MDVLNITIHNTLIDELVLCLIALFMIPCLTALMITSPEKRLKKKTRVIAVIVNTILIITMWVVCLNRVYEYELIEVKVSDWNEIINNEKFELVEYEGNNATLKRVLK